MDEWVIEFNYRYYISGDINADGLFGFFDLDETLITSYRGKNPERFNEDPEDWIYLGDVIEELNKLIDNGYSIIIVTNQSMCKGKREPILQYKFEEIRKDLALNGINVSFLISTNNDEYRKPNCGLFNLLFDILNIDTISSKSFMCGDAAYEISREGEFPDYDWSDSDIKFAKNCGIEFKRPNEIFKSNINKYNFNKYDVLILVGTMGSGKSTFAKNLTNFYHLESDKYKSNFKQMHKQYMKLLGETKIIVDATNPTEERRAEYYNPAINKGLKVAIVWFIRNGRNNNTLRSKPIPEIAYSKYSKNFQIPTSSKQLPVYRIF